MRDGYCDWLVNDQVLQQDFLRFILDDRAARVGVLLLDFLQLIHDHAAQLLFRSEDRFVFRDSRQDVFQLIDDLVDRETRKAMQLQFENCIGLLGIEWTLFIEQFAFNGRNLDKRSYGH